MDATCCTTPKEEKANFYMIPVRLNDLISNESQESNIE